ncbi:unnamed protein product [Tetraodon nigroviridis]|uniref:(spotted green pufferfish) hypothetical protein n=1 Tax=Tetraodon nigroviridis TaxID=99883 RepID=Q4S8A3_TETNG|nr:unnamed protein product [Tetraodon nigroviridis]
MGAFMERKQRRNGREKETWTQTGRDFSSASDSGLLSHSPCRTAPSHLLQKTAELDGEGGQRSYDLSSRNSDHSSRSSPSESSNPRSPKTGMRRIDLSAGRNPDAASARRTEISIEVSSKQIDSSPSPGIARFGLKRPEVSLSGRGTHQDAASNSVSGSTNRRAELSLTRPSEPPAPPKRMDAHLSSAPITRIPEPFQRRQEPLSPALNQTEGVSRRPELPVFKQAEGSVLENSHPPPAPSAPLPALAEAGVERVQSTVAEPPPARPSDSSEYPQPLFTVCF